MVLRALGQANMAVLLLVMMLSWACCPQPPLAIFVVIDTASSADDCIRLHAYTHYCCATYRQHHIASSVTVL